MCLSLNGISGQFLGHVSAFLSNNCFFLFYMVKRGKCHIQKQLFADIFKIEKFHNIHRKIPMLESVCNKVATLLKRDSNTDIFL